MKISREDVRNVAHLARLEMDEAAVDIYAEQIGNILDYIDQLNQSYDQFFSTSHSNTTTLTIDTNKMNFVSNSNDLKSIDTRIRQALKLAPFQAELPYIQQQEN